jgi:serine/threonine protein kinase
MAAHVENDENILGEGTYGVVKDMGDGEARKYFSKDGLIPSTVCEITAYKYLEKYAPNIIPNYRIVPTSSGFDLVMTKYDTDLHKLGKLRSFWSKNTTNKIFRALIVHLCNWTSAGLSHRDLKPQNIVVGLPSDMNVDDYINNIKVIDWGSAWCNTSELEKLQPSTIVCTLWFRSPELLMDRSVYDPKALDVWSLGMTMLHILDPNDKLKLRENDKELLIQQLLLLSDNDLRFSSWLETDLVDEQFKDLLDKMLCLNPKRRIKVEDIMAHPYMEGVFHSDPRKTEMKLQVVPNGFGKQPHFTTKARVVIFGWLVLIGFRYMLSLPTLILTFNIIDTFVSKYEIPKKDIQMVAIAALSLAVEVTDSEAFPATSGSMTSNDLYTADEITSMKLSIFNSIDMFELKHTNSILAKIDEFQDQNFLHILCIIYIIYAQSDVKYPVENMMGDIMNMYSHMTDSSYKLNPDNIKFAQLLKSTYLRPNNDLIKITQDQDVDYRIGLFIESL